MNRIAILCLEDEPEVREAIVRDLQPFAAAFRIEAAEDVADAREVLSQLAADGDRLGLALCDHLLPGERGVDLLVELQGKPDYAASRKMLITGQAGLEDTIRAVNEANLHHYIAKPWSAGDLQAAVRHQLSEFILATETDPLPYLAVLESERLLDVIATRRNDR